MPQRLDIGATSHSHVYFHAPVLRRYVASTHTIRPFACLKTVRARRISAAAMIDLLYQSGAWRALCARQPQARPSSSQRHQLCVRASRQSRSRCCQAYGSVRPGVHTAAAAASPCVGICTSCVSTLSKRKDGGAFSSEMGDGRSLTGDGIAHRQCCGLHGGQHNSLSGAQANQLHRARA